MTQDNEQGGHDNREHNHGHDHGHKKTFTIYVEGIPHEWPKTEISYKEVVSLVPDYKDNPDVTYSVTYERGHGNKPEGTLSPGGTVKVKEGMIFNVSDTGQS